MSAFFIESLTGVVVSSAWQSKGLSSDVCVTSCEVSDSEHQEVSGHFKVCVPRTVVSPNFVHSQ